MTQTATAAESTRADRALYIALDMGRDSWQLAASDGGKTRREVKINRTDLEAGKAELLAEISKGRDRFGLAVDAPVHVLYEAGRDGFWLARWLQGQGIGCIVIDPSAILVDRKAKHRHSHRPQSPRWPCRNSWRPPARRSLVTPPSPAADPRPQPPFTGLPPAEVAILREEAARLQWSIASWLGQLAAALAQVAD